VQHHSANAASLQVAQTGLEHALVTESATSTGRRRRSSAADPPATGAMAWASSLGDGRRSSRGDARPTTGSTEAEACRRPWRTTRSRVRCGGGRLPASCNRPKLASHRESRGVIGQFPRRVPRRRRGIRVGAPRAGRTTRGVTPDRRYYRRSRSRCHAGTCPGPARRAKRHEPLRGSNELDAGQPRPCGLASAVPRPGAQQASSSAGHPNAVRGP